MRTFVFTALAAAALAFPAHAQQAQHSGHQGMQHQGMQHQGMTHSMPMPQMSREQMMMHGGPAGPEFMANMHRMHERMMQQGIDRDPARSWALGMIEHHQGAIDNSRTVLKHATDKEVRGLAEKTIRENEKGIAELRSWLDRHGGRTPRH